MTDAIPFARHHAAELKLSGLTDDSLTLLASHGWRSESHDGEIAKVLGWEKWPKSRGDALMIPFWLPGDSEPRLYRAKPRAPRKRPGGRVVKYEQPKGAPTLPYYPHRTLREKRYADTGKPLIFVEGEKKAELLDQLGYATVGLCGVWNWGDPEYARIYGRRRLSPHIGAHCKTIDRECLIVYDADAATNSQVMRAAQELAGVLRATGASSVRLAIVPAGDDDSAKMGIDDYAAKYGPVAVRRLLAEAREVEGIDPGNGFVPALTFSAMKGAPMDETVRVPTDYDIDGHGRLWSKPIDDKARIISPAPIFLTRALYDIETGEERAEVIFRVRNGWRKVIVDRVALMNARDMVQALAPQGAPVSSRNAGALVDWFQALEACNEETIRVTACAARCGWQRIKSDAPLFVCGDFVATSEDKAPDIVWDDRDNRARIGRALRTRGDADAHLAAVKEAFDADIKAAVAIAGAFAAPLLELLAAPGFAIHLAGDSSRGKSSMLKIAASIYGDPNSGEIIGSWNTTSVGLEVRAHTLNGLPFCVDEAGVIDARERERAMYMLGNGVGRTRGARGGGLRSSHEWRTVILSTGEHRVVEDTANAGAKVRVLQFPVDGFGDLGAAEVDRIRLAAEENFGHVGRRWLRYLATLAASAERVDKIRAMVKSYATAAREEFGGNSLAARRAGYVAVLAVAEALAADAFDGGVGDDTGATIWRLVRPDSDLARDRIKTSSEMAWEIIQDFVAQNRSRFGLCAPDYPGAQRGKLSPPRVEIAGFLVPKLDVRGVDSDGRARDFVGLIPGELNAVLTRAGLSPGVVRRELERLGTEGERVAVGRRRIRAGEDLIWLYLIDAEALGVTCPQTTGGLSHDGDWED